MVDAFIDTSVVHQFVHPERGPATEAGLRWTCARGVRVRLPEPVLYELLEQFDRQSSITWDLWNERKAALRAIVDRDEPVAVDLDRRAMFETLSARVGDAAASAERTTTAQVCRQAWRALCIAGARCSFHACLVADLREPYPDALAQLGAGKEARLRRIHQLGAAWRVHEIDRLVNPDRYPESAGRTPVSEAEAVESLVAEGAAAATGLHAAMVVERVFRTKKETDRNTPIDALIASYAELAGAAVLTCERRWLKLRPQFPRIFWWDRGQSLPADFVAFVEATRAER